MPRRTVDQEPKKSFTPEESAKIRDAIWAASEHLECPSCGGRLTINPPADGGSSTAFWEVRCDQCGRSQVMQDLL